MNDVEKFVESLSNVLKEREFNEKEIEKMRQQVDSIASKEEHTDAEAELLLIWWLYETRVAETESKPVDLSWAHHILE